MVPQFKLDANVIIFSLFPGVREDLIRHIIATPNLRSIVMRTFGSGNAPRSPWLLSALRQGTKAGKVIVNISQCMQGSVQMGRYDTGYQLKEAGVVSGYNSTVEASVTKLMYLQGKYDDNEQVRLMMTRSLCGETTMF
jgi:L-asparaginase